MLTKRIIPCLDIKEGRVVKGVNFVGLKDAGSPLEVSKRYNEMGADELVFLDINASHEKRSATLSTIEEVASNVFIPLTIGGGISLIEDISVLLNTGCDKISLNSKALENPSLVKESAKVFGSSCTVVAVDVRWDGSKFCVFSHGGRTDTGREMKEWLKEVQDLGAGEVLLTSMDKDGTKSGFDLKALDLASSVLKVPLIASGGAGVKEHFLEVFLKCDVDAALAASVFHYHEIDISELKNYLKSNGIEVRL
ncbi:imidazole glycerol phosphate synthase subunit HisF [Helicobacter sp. 11S02629-2]|uniref:imidazole glycerol phosphate synthase subunit HisF n=1 Tax=Helicobacter sp. 11S02629-2 TaxID=1476195 RepID=UPI000BA7E02A|nr:imidazole glycerol phosphate synthase subunit HisF [Helicobacter sp. 11S02629-2]PAF45629.1 imidazole glycerol phosphate synthase subunit HisF [Helicobacter sp. 11S02629-2]